MWVRKNFQKVKECYVQKYLGNNILGSKILLCPIKFKSKKIWVKNITDPKNVVSKKNLGAKILSPKTFWSKKSSGSKTSGQKNLRQKEILGESLVKIR